MSNIMNFDSLNVRLLRLSNFIVVLYYSTTSVHVPSFFFFKWLCFSTFHFQLDLFKNSYFQPALPPPVWTEPFDAIDKHVVCPQPSFGLSLSTELVMQEDCLIANVFVPNT